MSCGSPWKEASVGYWTTWVHTEEKWGNFIDINEANLDVPATPALWLNSYTNDPRTAPPSNQIEKKKFF